MPSSQLTTIPTQSAEPNTAANSIGRIKDPDLQRSHRQIEEVISKYERLIEKISGNYARHYKSTGLSQDDFKSNIYIKLWRSCCKDDTLINLVGTDAVNYASTIINRACIDQLRKNGFSKNGIVTKQFSQLEEFNAGEIAERRQAESSPMQERGELACRLSDKLNSLGIELTDRQFNILLKKIGASFDDKQITYSQIGHGLGISEVTVKRDYRKIRDVIRAHTGEEVAEKNPETNARRNDYKFILQHADRYKISQRIKDYIELYLDLTANGDRPKESEVTKILKITPDQVKRCQRSLKEIRESLNPELVAKAA